MKECPHCHKELTKSKLTLSVNSEILDNFKLLDINISEFVEDAMEKRLQKEKKI